MQWLFFAYFWGGAPRLWNGYTLITTLSALVLTLAIARFSWRFIENPLIRFGHRSDYQFAASTEETSSPSVPELVGRNVGSSFAASREIPD
jgi:peptidoglycan/LPS O-acetylase OafA/YrhL